MAKKENKVVVGLSGGVDSSVAALLLKQQGFEVVGLHMKNANEAERAEDEKSVKELCKKLGIECHIAEYDDEMQIVKDYFAKEYAAGRTPNPCVVCNQYVKFKPFIKFANDLGADYFATGHYAKIEHKNCQHILKKAKDEQKDQSYFLNGLSQNQLEKALFPLGELSKSEVRKIAEENDLASADKKESQDVCFVGSKKFKDYIGGIYPQKEGDIVNISDGKIVGRHSGIMKYTIGQRKGLGIGGGYGETGEGWFVTKKDAKANIIYVSQGDGEELLSDSLICNKFNWIPNIPSEKLFDCKAKFRYRQTEQDVRVEISDDEKVLMTFKQKQRAITIGQYAVLYNSNGECLGGGEISQVFKNGKEI